MPPTSSSEARCSCASAHAASTSGRSSAESTATSTLAITGPTSLPAPASSPEHSPRCGTVPRKTAGTKRVASDRRREDANPALADRQAAVRVAPGAQAGRRAAVGLGREGGTQLVGGGRRRMRALEPRLERHRLLVAVGVAHVEPARADRRDERVLRQRGGVRRVAQPLERVVAGGGPPGRRARGGGPEHPPPPPPPPPRPP